MPELPQLLIDNDIFIILAGANLLTPAVSLLGFELTSIRHLKALPYMIRGRKRRNEFSATVIERVVQACKDTPVLTENPSISFEQELTDVVNIDAGEAVLYALLAEHPFYLLTSNDKRAMRTLVTEKSLQHIQASIAGRVVCLETLMLKMVEHYGVEEIGTKLAPVLSNNQVLRIAFSPGCIAKPEECFWALHRHENKLKREVGKDFLWEFPL